MPTKALHPCAEPRCPRLTNKSRCDCHDLKRQHYAQHPRGSSTKQGYGSEWRKVRLLALIRDMHQCQHCGRPATDVDHVVARKDGGTDEIENLRSLCRSCHSRKTAREDARWG